MFVCFRLSGGVVLPVQRTDQQSNQRRFMSNHTVPLKSFRKWCVLNRIESNRIKSYRRMPCIVSYRIVRLVYCYSPTVQYRHWSSKQDEFRLQIKDGRIPKVSLWSAFPKYATYCYRKFFDRTYHFVRNSFNRLFYCNLKPTPFK